MKLLAFLGFLAVAWLVWGTKGRRPDFWDFGDQCPYKIEPDPHP